MRAIRARTMSRAACLSAPTGPAACGARQHLELMAERQSSRAGARRAFGDRFGASAAGRRARTWLPESVAAPAAKNQSSQQERLFGRDSRVCRTFPQRNHRHIAAKHLVPQFGTWAISKVRSQDVQAYIAQLAKAGYAPKTIDHIHDVLSAVLRTAVKWGHLQRQSRLTGVDLPRLKTVRPKWALPERASCGLDRTCAVIGSGRWWGWRWLTGLRRGELFALRWRDIEEVNQSLTAREAVYEGMFDTPRDGGWRSPDSLSGGARSG